MEPGTRPGAYSLREIWGKTLGEHVPTRKRRIPTPATGPADERHHFFGRRSFERSRDMLATIDFEGVVRDVNGAWERQLGFSRDEMVGRPAREFIHPEDWPMTATEADKLRDGGQKTAEFEIRYRRKQGDWAWLEWRARVASIEGLIYASARETTARKRREAELERAALIDPLTGLANRRGFERALSRELAAARRHQHSPALVMLDLDRFKAANDTYGHQTGDALLLLAAQTISETIRESDLPARIGGDEFAVLLPDSELPTAELVARKLIETLRTLELKADGETIHVTASAGAALLGQPGVTDAKGLLRAADSALYRAKDRRSSFVIYTGDISAS
jgi:diguanylate cyclase (GGDEF)-like protein/PAS domain S-box-containing protein